MSSENTPELGFFARRRAIREAEAASASAIKPLPGESTATGNTGDQGSAGGKGLDGAGEPVSLPSSIKGDVDLSKPAVEPGEEPTLDQAAKEVKTAAEELGSKIAQGDLVGAAESLGKVGEGVIDMAAAVVNKVEDATGSGKD